MTDRHSFDDLCALADLPRRTVRYYIQRGLVDRPVGETRAAYYTARHLEQLLTIRKWSGAGLSLERIAELLGGRAAELPPPRRKPGEIAVWSHLHVAEGVQLQIEPALAGLTPEQVRALVRGVMALFDEVQRGGEPQRNTTPSQGE